MAGAAAAMSIRLTTVVDVVVDGEIESSGRHSSTDKQGEYYHMKKRYQDSDSTSSSTGMAYARGL